MAKTKKVKFLGISYSWYVIICAGLFYAYQYVLRVAPNVMNDELLRDLGIDATEFGTMISFYWWSYAGVQIPLGIALDRFGTGKLLTLASLFCGLSCFIFAATSSIYVCSAAMFLIGLGSACAFLGAIKLGTVWFSPKQLASVVAIVLVFGTIGASLGSTPLSALIDMIGWQAVMQVLGVCGLVLSLIIYFIIGRYPETIIYEPSVTLFTGLKLIAKTPQAWLISFYGMLMYGPIAIMGTAWGIPFIKVAYNIDEKIAATVTTLMFIGAAVGSPIFSAFSDKLQRRVVPMFVGALACTVIYCVIIFIPNLSFSLVYFLFFAAGFCYTAKSLSFTSMCEITPQAYSGAAIGFINTITMASGIVCYPIIGKLMVSHWDGTVVNAVNFYSEADYRFALTIVPISLFVSLLLCRFMRESHHAHPLTQAQKTAALSDLD